MSTQTIAPRINGNVPATRGYAGMAGFAVRERWIADPQHASATTRNATAQKLAQKFVQSFTPGTQAWSPPT